MPLLLPLGSSSASSSSRGRRFRRSCRGSAGAAAWPSREPSQSGSAPPRPSVRGPPRAIGRTHETNCFVLYMYYFFGSLAALRYPN
eukprot:scaffold19052_cov117-Isochrysis_galbana.AAC.5